MTTVADQFAETLVAAGVKRIYGIVGDSLNGLTDAIRIVDRNDCGVTGTVTDRIYRLGVLAFRCNSGIVTAFAEDSMETLAGSNDAS